MNNPPNGGGALAGLLILVAPFAFLAFFFLWARRNQGVGMRKMDVALDQNRRSLEVAEAILEEQRETNWLLARLVDLMENPEP